MECMKCKITKGDSVILCDSCQRSTHRDCSGLSASELKVMDLKGKRYLKFYCEDCQNGVKLIPKLLVKIDTLETEINKLKTMVETSGQNIVSISNKEDLLYEMNDRNNRASNIIIFNVNESKKATAQQRQSEDSKTVDNILQNFNNIDQNNIKNFRLGKFEPNKSRPIKVVLKSVEDAKYVLKNRNLAAGQGVKIVGDQTKMQRVYYKWVKAELDKLIQSGVSNKTIKYINNKPTIVDKLDQNKKN